MDITKLVNQNVIEELSQNFNENSSFVIINSFLEEEQKKK